MSGPDETDISRRKFLSQMAAGACAAGALLHHGLDEAEAAGAQKTYTNPVYAGSMPDPFVLRHRGLYYAFGTTGGERKSDGRIFTLLRSNDLVHWRELGGALMEPTADRAYQFWAPEVAYEGGTFYLYYAMGGREEEKFELRVATSRRPEGPYRDAGVKLLDCEQNRFTIDAHPFRDDDGRW